jgi:hypothetical protein
MSFVFVKALVEVNVPRAVAMTTVVVLTRSAILTHESVDYLHVKETQIVQKMVPTVLPMVIVMKVAAQIPTAVNPIPTMVDLLRVTKKLGSA